MLIKNLFERDIFRPINGVVKADQLDDSSVWQELDEFVITRELDQHFRKFISWYLEAVDQQKNPDPDASMFRLHTHCWSARAEFYPVERPLVAKATVRFQGEPLVQLMPRREPLSARAQTGCGAMAQYDLILSADNELYI